MTIVSESTGIRAHALWRRLQALPKVDLHRHLEGSLRLATLAEVALKHGVDLPSYDLEVLRPYVQVTSNEEPDFHTFLNKFNLLRRFYSSREAIERVAFEAVADAAADNVRYLELRFNPFALSETQGFGIEEVTEWVLGAIAAASQACPIKVRLLATIRRDSTPEAAEVIARLAVRYHPEGIVGLDLAGDEVNYPHPPFVETFRWAQDQGLRVTIHAGEATGPDSIRYAIDQYAADRIGHGVRAREDQAVVDLLRERQIPLEMCPTSNIHTGAVKKIGDHPSSQYHRDGLCVTINTDDPSISNITLSDEYLVAIRGIGLTFCDLDAIILNAAQAAFLPDDEKEGLWRQLDRELDHYRT